MADLVSVLVRTNSLLLGWYEVYNVSLSLAKDSRNGTPMILVFLATPSLGQLKLPLSNLNARNFLLPPLTRTSWIRFAPIRVLAG